MDDNFYTKVYILLLKSNDEFFTLLQVFKRFNKIPIHSSSLPSDDYTLTRSYRSRETGGPSANFGTTFTK